MQGLTCAFAGLLFVGTIGLDAQEPQKPAAPTAQLPAPEIKPLPEVPEPAVGDGLYAPVVLGNAPGESLKTKTDTWLVLSFGPRALVSPLIPSAIKMAKPNYNYPNDWHQGMQGFARQYGSSYGTKVAEQTGRFAAGALLHEDFRYRPSESRNFFLRVGHAIGYTFVDRSDNGSPRLALANFAGAAAGGFTPNLWLPDGFNDAKHGGTRTLTKIGGFAGQNVAREFAPEIAKVFQALHLPFPRLPVPEWWTKDISIARR